MKPRSEIDKNERKATKKKIIIKQRKQIEVTSSA